MNHKILGKKTIFPVLKLQYSPGPISQGKESGERRDALGFALIS